MEEKKDFTTEGLVEVTIDEVRRKEKYDKFKAKFEDSMSAKNMERYVEAKLGDKEVMLEQEIVGQVG